jgi:hypothetical protein
MRRLYFPLALLAVLAAGCRPPVVEYESRSKFEYPVAKVGDRYQIEMKDLHDSLYFAMLDTDSGLVGVDSLKRILDNIIIDSLNGFEAQNIRLEDNYSECRMYRRRYQSSLVDVFWDKMVYDSAGVDSVEVHEFYTTRPDIFTVPEQVLVHQVFVAVVTLKTGEDSLHFADLMGEDLEREGLAYTQRLKSMIDDMPFSEVARDYSHDRNSSSTGGLVGWTQREVYRDPFDSVAFSTPEGTVAEPYRDADGWHILYVERHLPEGVPPWDSLSYRFAIETLINTKVNTRRRHYLDSLKSLPLDIRYRDEIIDTNVFNVDPQEWAVIINSVDTIDFGEMQALELQLRGKYQVANTNLLMKQEGIKTLTDRYLIIQAVRDLKFDTLARVRSNEASLWHRHAKNVAQTRILPDASWNPSDGLIRDYYDRHIDQYTVAKPLKLQHIIVADSSFGEFLRAQAMAGEDFLELAEQYYPGELAVRRELADLGWAGQEDILPEIWTAGTITNKGEVSHPVKSEFGYHIVKLVDRHYGQGLSQTSGSIRGILRREYMDEERSAYRDVLFERYEVTFPNELTPIMLPPVEHRVR